ncbi:MAG TPA: M20 family metallopeptidase [Blastocatellia bacterium]|nr:M20 family metallopeptidase [Blastocatellia bacterium]
MQSLHNYFNQRDSVTLFFIRRLVEIETTSREETQLNRIAHLIAQELQPFADNIELFDNSGYGTNLRARFNFNHPSNTPYVLVIGHMDTVWPLGTLERLPFRVTEEGTAHGPGTFDMKAGVAIAIEALRAITELKKATNYPIVLLLTCDEEIGSPSSRALIEETARNAVAAFVIEPPIPGGIAKTGRKGIGDFLLRVKGRAAHAGLEPEKGINAIVELSHQVLRLAKLNDFARGLTVNVGVMSGGTTSNVVPAEASAEIDVRFWQPEDAEYITRAITHLEPVLDGASLEIDGVINRPPMPRSERNLMLFEQAAGFAAELGFELREGVVGGGSDGNFTAALGVPTLDGLGVDGAGAHAEHEHIVIADIPRRTALLTQILSRTQIRS